MTFIMVLFLLMNVFLFLGVKAQLKIVNGTDVEGNNYKFMVSVQTFNRHSCGGTILNRDHILTAAHCVCQMNQKINQISVRKSIDSLLANPVSIDFPIKKISCHNYGTIEYINDLAILQLQFPIPDPFYEKVKLASRSFSTQFDSEGVILGWGLNATNGSMQDRLQQVAVTVYSDETCKRSWSGIRNTEYQICAGWQYNGRGSCQGDSGGPLLVNGLQIGIVSLGAKGDCSISNKERPKIFTRISKYLDWIELNSDSNIHFDDDTLLPTKTSPQETTSSVISTTTKNPQDISKPQELTTQKSINHNDDESVNYSTDDSTSLKFNISLMLVLNCFLIKFILICFKVLLNETYT